MLRRLRNGYAAVSPLTLAIGSGVAIAIVASIVVATRTRHAAAPLGIGDPSMAPDPELVAWCAPGLEPIAGGGCFAAAAVDAGTPKLLVYLHGMYAPTEAGVAEELDRQARVADVATKKGYSVLALRGKQGQCLQPEVADWFCWPSNERTQDAGPSYVASWSTALAEAEARGGTGKRYLLGFSNGGYFAALIATRELIDFDAVAIAGAGPVEPVRALGTKPPILLITADSDASVLSAIQFDQQLTRERWPHAIVTRDGGHALESGDISNALTFFRRSASEAFPLSPPMSLRAPVPMLDAVDAGVLQTGEAVDAAPVALPLAPPSLNESGDEAGSNSIEEPPLDMP
ncbi:hypothetical protein BH09MYX1_BH09MYX1_46220 [soil metagenome]